MRVVLIAMLVIGTASAADPVTDIRKDNPTIACRDQGPNTLYFPVGTFQESDRSDNRSDVLYREWLSPHLASMGEPSFTCGATDDTESIRFLWLRSFNQPIAIRISRRDKGYVLRATVMNGMGGYSDTKDVAQRVEVAVSDKDWHAALSALDMIRFWEMPADANDAGPDGSVWVIEVRSQGKYHLAKRFMGGHGLRQVGLLLLSLSGLSIPAEDLY